MGKPSAPSAPTQVSSITIPEYAKGYMERLLGDTEALTQTPRQTYTGETFAQPTLDQMIVRQRTRDLQLPPGLLEGQQMIRGAGQRALAAGQYNPMAFQMERVNAPTLGPTRQFTSAEAAKYESPYLDRVLDIQKQRAIQDAKKTQLADNLASVRRGTYGGSRQALLQAEREKALGEKLGDIEAFGREKAFQRAADQFERDRAAQMLGEQFGAKQTQEAALANQLRALGTQQALEQSRQFGALQGIRGIDALRQAGATMADIGKTESVTEMAQLDFMDRIAKQQALEDQRYLDYLQSEFQAQQEDPYKRLGFMSDILRGTSALQGGTAMYEAPQSALQQIVGTGLPAFALYRSLMGTAG